MVECDTEKPLLATGYVFYGSSLLDEGERQCALCSTVPKCAGVSLLSSVRQASSHVMLMIFKQS